MTERTGKDNCSTLYCGIGLPDWMFLPQIQKRSFFRYRWQQKINFAFSYFFFFFTKIDNISYSLAFYVGATYDSAICYLSLSLSLSLSWDSCRMSLNFVTVDIVLPSISQSPTFILFHSTGHCRFVLIGSIDCKTCSHHFCLHAKLVWKLHAIYFWNILIK